MARVLENLFPERVCYHFETLCGIPHGSGNVKKLADYLCFFAKMHNLTYYRDKSDNVIIRKDASQGFMTADPVILQGHMDMVCAKVPESTHDFLKEGLDLRTDGEIIWAEGTTLGGDDGIAVAMMLAILESEEIRHPALECVFTTNEEIGMLGAKALDMSKIKGRTLINIDSENEGILTVSCAGGAACIISIPTEKSGNKKPSYRVCISGLTGGHSGMEIHKGRANAAVLAGEFMRESRAELVAISGGTADNAIMPGCEMVVCGDSLEEAAKKIELSAKSRFPEEKITVKVVPTGLNETPTDFDFGEFMKQAPYGVQAMSKEIKGLVQTSLNIGIIKTEEDSVVMVYSVRSSVNKEKEKLLNVLEKIAKKFHGTVKIEGAYPAWEYRKNSPLRDRMVRVFSELYDKEVKVEAIHAGLECGLFSDAIKGLDAVSIGPDIPDIHTPKERLPVSSVARTWNYVLAVLEDMGPEQHEEE